MKQIFILIVCLILGVQAHAQKREKSFRQTQYEQNRKYSWFTCWFDGDYAADHSLMGYPVVLIDGLRKGNIIHVRKQKMSRKNRKQGYGKYWITVRVDFGRSITDVLIQDIKTEIPLGVEYRKIVKTEMEVL